MKEAGSENPWRQFHGRSAPYLRARAAPAPSTGEITWSSDGTKRLADRVIELKDHEIGVLEHDILSTAIDMPEHRGRVRGVSRSTGWKEAFGKENECLWKKNKRSSVDPDRLKQEIMDEIFGKLRAAGIVDAALGASIGKSSCTSKELGQGVVLPEEKVCHTVPVQDGYVVVKIDHVHQNAEAIPLDIPLPDAEIFTLGDARNTRIQWKKSDAASTVREIDQATKDQTLEPVTVVASGSPPKKKGRTTPKAAATKKGRGKAAAAKKATEVKGKEAPKEPTNTWTLAHPKFVMGKPMLTTEEELASAGVNTSGLHKHYISHAMHQEDPSIVGEFKA
ncbi:hypothetical protein C2845_PM07G09490 [Panicum miliaceum]|uniref:DUF8039 domain-containing protein n=1 Tax=Panicum miliaceum TaxID=4540 RepID=A0A3L6SKC6_PANMI|nr:hypothetical protein C2845_PM07G09490 [Panicum miliaceum]